MPDKRYSPLITPGPVNSDLSNKTYSRRQILSAAGVALGGMATTNALGQVTGVSPDGGAPPFKLARGALDYLDQNQYINNMEIVSHIEGPNISGGEPLMNMWAKGDQRMLPARRGGSDPGSWVDISDPRNPVEIAANVEPALGNLGCVSYNTKLKKWLRMQSVIEPFTVPVPQYPHGSDHEEYRQKSFAYKGLRGIRVYDVTDPGKPKVLGEFSTGENGKGTHMNFYDGGRYAYLEAGWSDQLRMDNRHDVSGMGIMVVDMSDPEKITEVSRWHHPGQMVGEEKEYDKLIWADTKSAWTSIHGAPVVPQRIEDGGRYGYCGYGHWGFFVMDFSDIKNPKPVGQTRWQFETMGSIPYHSVYPVHAYADTPRQLRNIVIGVPEVLQADCREPYKPTQVIDVSDPTKPRIIGLFPRPEAPSEAPYSDFCLSRGRFGTHNIQDWVAPGKARPEIVVMTHFNAGIRVYDISDPTAPKELAYFIPPRGGEMEDYLSWYRGDAETVFIEWDRNLIWLGTHHGTYCLSTPALGKPVLERRKVEQWTQPHLNKGWDS